MHIIVNIITNFIFLIKVIFSFKNIISGIKRENNKICDFVKKVIEKKIDEIIKNLIESFFNDWKK